MNAIDLSPLENEMRNMTRAINKKPVYLGLDYEQRRNAVTESIREGNKLIRKHYKNKGF